MAKQSYYDLEKVEHRRAVAARSFSELANRKGQLAYDQQTTKQPVWMRCPNPECCEKGEPYFDFQSDYPKCPKCSLGPPAVEKRALMHLLVRDPKGPVVGQLGLRYALACDKKRDYLATWRNGEAATGSPKDVNCPGCKKSKAYKAGILSGSQELYMNEVGK